MAWSDLLFTDSATFRKRLLTEGKGLFRAYAVIFSMTFAFFGMYIIIGALFGGVEGSVFVSYIVVGGSCALAGAALLMRIFFGKRSSTGLFGDTFVRKYSEEQCLGADGSSIPKTALQLNQSPNASEKSGLPRGAIDCDYPNGAKRKIDVLNLPSFTTLAGIFATFFIISSVLVFIGSVMVLFALPFIFLTITAIPLMWVAYVTKKSIYRPPPARSVLMALTWGMISTLPSLVLNTTLGAISGGNMLLVASVGAPLFEEFWKPWGVRLVKADVHRELDGVIYGVCCGIGFATIENMAYALPSIASALANPFSLSGYAGLVLVRSLASLVGHMVGPALIGLAFGRYMRLKRENAALDGVASSQNAFEKKGLSESVLGAFLMIPAGYIGGVGMHAMWNGSLYLGESLSNVEPWLLLLGTLGFIVLFPLFEIGMIRQIVTLAVIKEIELNAPYSYSHPPPSVIKGGLELLDKAGVPMTSELMRSPLAGILFPWHAHRRSSTG